MSSATKDAQASGIFLSQHARVQKVLYSILKLEKNEDGTESFVELLEPSPTVDEAMAAMGLERDGTISVEAEGRTLKVVIGKLDKVLMGLDANAREDGRLEAKLKEFEDEVEMPAAGRGGLFGLLSQPGVKVEAVVMFLSNHFDAETAAGEHGEGGANGN